MGLPLIPTPDTLKGVDDLIRSGLEAYRESCFNWLLVSTGLVVVGLLFEAPEIWHETVKAINELLHSCNPERPILAWMKLAGTLGWVLIIIGVAGEFVADSFVSKADGFVQTFDEILLAETTKQAGDARMSAEGAAKAASEAKASAKVIGEQAATLEATTKRLIWQGPRDILLSDAGKSFKTLRPFSGQRFRFSICRPDLNPTKMTGLGLTEIGRTLQAIFIQLYKAGWRVAGGVPPGSPFPYIADGCASVSVSVNPSNSATKITRDGAVALQSVLNGVLSDNTPVGFGGKLSPDPGPDVIDIHIGLHPASPKAMAKKYK